MADRTVLDEIAGEPSAPVAPDERRALNAEVQDYMIACGQHAEARRVAEARIAALEAENAALKARNAALEDGLRPFAKLGELFPPAVYPGGYDEGIYCPAAGPEYAIGGNDLRRARALLQGGPDAG